MSEPIDDHLVETPDSLRDSDPEAPALDGGAQETDSYLAAESFGVTAEEERQGESLDQRLAEEEPEVVAATGPPDPPAGRLVAEDEGAHPDRESDEVAQSVGVDGGDFSAEEAAVHIIDEP